MATIDIDVCPCCGQKHEGLDLHVLPAPEVDYGCTWTNWALCPAEQDIIRLRIWGRRVRQLEPSEVKAAGNSR